MTRTSNVIAFAALSFATTTTEAFVVVAPAQRQTSMSMSAAQAPGFLHGQGSAFMPLEQLDQEYFAPRIVQIAGAYPGITIEEIMAVSSEPAAQAGQWTYDFSDPDGPQLGTVAIQGSSTVQSAEDPIVLIAEHPSLGIDLPPAITEPVDLIVMVDRAKTFFQERKFLVVDAPSTGGVTIGAYTAKEDVPADGTIVGQVVLVQIPWLPCMKPSKSGFMESDEYF